MSEACKKLCIDSMCRANPYDTICGGCYCESCRELADEDGLCDKCRHDEEDEMNEEPNEN